MLKEIKVDDIVLIGGGGKMPFFAKIVKVGNTFFETDEGKFNNKYDNKDGHFKGDKYDRKSKYIICKKEYILNII